MFENKEFKEAADKVLLTRGKRKHNIGLTITPNMTKDQLSEMLLAAQERGLLEKLSQLGIEVPSGMARKERVDWAQMALSAVQWMKDSHEDSPNHEPMYGVLAGRSE